MIGVDESRGGLVIEMDIKRFFGHDLKSRMRQFGMSGSVGGLDGQPFRSSRPALKLIKILKCKFFLDKKSYLVYQIELYFTKLNWDSMFRGNLIFKH